MVVVAAAVVRRNCHHQHHQHQHRRRRSQIASYSPQKIRAGAATRCGAVLRTASQTRYRSCCARLMPPRRRGHSAWIGQTERTACPWGSRSSPSAPWWPWRTRSRLPPPKEAGVLVRVPPLRVELEQQRCSVACAALDAVRRVIAPGLDDRVDILQLLLATGTVSTSGCHACGRGAGRGGAGLGGGSCRAR